MHLSRMSANPHFYDYIHFLNFQEDGSVELIDGAGQLINTVARGNYRVGTVTQNSAEVTFYNLVEVNSASRLLGTS